MRKQYKPGDDVVPKITLRGAPADTEDQRLMEQIRQLSLQEVGVSGSNLVESRPGRDTERSRETGRGPRDHHRAYDANRRSPGGTYLNYRPAEGGRRPHPSQRAASSRQVGHQSSLRSLLSASELDSTEMEEEIMRQILEEGLLDGIDLDNIDVSQEDEISERIAQAYRRRQRQQERERERERERRRQSQEHGNSSNQRAPQRLPDPEQQRRRPHAHSESGNAQQTQTARPPVSRPHLFEDANASRRHERRSSSQGSGRSARSHNPRQLVIDSSRPAAHSTTDLSERPPSSRGSAERQRRLSQHDRRTTDPETRRARDQWRSDALGGNGRSNPNSPRGAAFAPQPTESPTSTVPPGSEATVVVPPHTADGPPTPTGQALRPVNRTPPSVINPSAIELPVTEIRPDSSSANAAPPRPALYPEPSISCDRCEKPHIEYEAHYNCHRCREGNFNLCIRCYRLGKGCLHWYGFGNSAWARYERQAPPGGYPAGYEHPHILTGHRYSQPSRGLLGSENAGEPFMSDEDPSKRLQAGVFCDICHAFANSCYWKCDSCNDGAWGFCNACVNQGRHCTHPLLPIAQKAATTASDTANTEDVPQSSQASNPPQITPKSASITRGPGLVTYANTLFKPLTFTTNCDICHYPIPPSHTRFHCPRCNDGDYDICVSCYQGLVLKGRISAENGPSGWRRCQRGHRMLVVGFEERGDGQRRVVTRELVGGLALRDEDGGDSQAVVGQGSNADARATPNWSWRDPDGTVRKARAGSGREAVQPGSMGMAQARFPPDGGFGLRVQALWGYFPAEGVEDELMFPKGAEIREGQDINGDWFWGAYAGRTGLFPGNYGRVV